MTQPFIHALADVQATAIGAGTRVWQSAIVLAGVKIGEAYNPGSHCLIDNEVVIGDRANVKRDALQKQLDAAAGIGALTYYPIPPDLEPTYVFSDLRIGQFPAADQCLNLTMAPHLTNARAGEVISAVNEAARRLAG